MTLHDELHRIATQAPDVDVPDDLWSRGRRARVRDRVAVLAAAAAVVALVAGLVAWLPAPTAPPIADTSSLGVPDHLYVPEGLDPTSDLEVGVAAAAWQDPSRVVVVVGADGTYNVVEPPGFDDLFMTGHTVALSPDGTQLAYAWADRDARLTAIRVVDLTSGEPRVVRIANGPVAVERLAWSANGRWLAWLGSPITWQDDGSFSGRGSLAGRVAAGATRSQDVGAVPNDANLSLAVSPGGTVMLTSTNALLQARPGWRDRVAADLGRLSPTSIVEPATGQIVAGVGGDGPTALPPAGTLAVRIDPTTGRRQWYSGGEPRLMSTPLGFVDGALLVAVSPMDASGEHGDRRIELVGTDGAAQRVVEMDDLVPDGLTLATDMMSADRLTVDRPEPDWPSSWWTEPRPLILIAGVALLTLVMVALTRRRHR